MTRSSTVLGYPYLKGLKKLASMGSYPSRITVVKPPFARYGKGTLRIIGERKDDYGLELLLSYEDYETENRRQRTGDGKQMTEEICDF